MKVLVLTGPESSGKSWLAAEIQTHFGGLVVGEYVRHFINEQQRDTGYADIGDIARYMLIQIVPASSCWDIRMLRARFWVHTPAASP